MSIAALDKVTIIGHHNNKEEVLAGLQALGCLHLIPLTREGEAIADSGPSKDAREALRFLASCAQQRRQVTDPKRFDAHQVEEAGPGAAATHIRVAQPARLYFPAYRQSSTVGRLRVSDTGATWRTAPVVLPRAPSRNEKRRAQWITLGE